MANESSFRISADTTPYQEAMARLTQSTNEAVSNIKERFETVNQSFESMKGIFESAVAVLAGGEIANKLNEIAERAAGIRETAETFNLSTQALQGMQAMANESGVSSEKLQRTMATLDQKMRTAGEAGGKAAEQFNRLGITTEELNDPAFTVQMAFEKLGASSNSNAALIQLLGARGAQLIPVLREMAAHHDAVAEAAKKVGAITDQEAGALAVYGGEVSNASMAWQNFETRVAMTLMPVLDAAAGKMAEWAANTDHAAMVGNIFRAVIDAIATVFIRVVMAGRMLIDVIMGVDSIGIDVFTGLSATLEAFAEGPILGVARALQDLQSGDYSKIGSDLISGFKTAGAVLGESAARVKADFDNMVAYIGDDAKEATQRIQAMQDVLGATAKQPAAIPKATTAPTIDLTAMRDAMDKAFDKISEEANAKIAKTFTEITAGIVADAKTQEDAEVGAIDRQIAKVQELGRTHQISASQELTQENALLAQKWAAQQSYYAKLAAEYSGNLTKLSQINQQEEAAWQKHLDEMEKAQDAAAAATEKQWQTVGDSISRSLNTAVDGMLRRTQTFQQSMVKLFDQMAMGIIASLIRIGVQQAIQAATGLAAQKTAQQQAVLVDAKKAASGAYASVSSIPYIGWILAPAAAVAAFAAVEGFSAEGGYDIPAGINPQTQLHQREMVLPAELADTVREGVSGGPGGGLHVHLSSHDPKGFRDQLHNSSSDLHRALSSYVKRGGR